MARSPSEKQIRLADEIAYTLNIDFPQSSTDFTARAYRNFITDHIKDMRMIWNKRRIGRRKKQKGFHIRRINNG